MAQWVKTQLGRWGAVWVWAAAFLYSAMTVLGYNLEKHNTVVPGGNYLLLLACLAAGTVLFALALAALLFLTEKIRWREGQGLRLRWFFAFWGIILLCWLPLFLGAFPGIFSYDSNLQITWFITDYRSAHHAVIHTAMLGGLVELGHTLFGSYQAGAVLYTVVQMVLMAGLFAGTCMYLSACRAPRWLIAASVLFYGLYVANGYFAMAATKDSLFSALFCFFAAQLLLMSRDADRFFASKGQLALFAATMFLLMIFRNNTFHTLLASLPFFLAGFRRHWKRLLLVMLIPMCLLKVYQGPFYKAMGIIPGDAREAYSVIIQPLARLYFLMPETFSAEERELLYEVIPEEYLERYVARQSDPVRWGFDTPAFNEHAGEFLSLWIEKGLEHPVIYVDAVLSTSYGLWYPWHEYPDAATSQTFVEYNYGTEIQEILQIRRAPLWEWMNEVNYQICQEAALQHIPVIGFFFSGASFLWYLLFVTLYLFWKKNWRRLWVLIPLWAYFGTLLLGPVSNMRYMYPLAVCLPVLVYILAERRGEGVVNR